MSALAIAAGIVCVMMGKVGQAIALILTGTALISLNIVLDDYRWLIGPLGLAFGVGAVALVAGQYLGFWNFKKKLVAEAEAPRDPMNVNEWTPQEKETLAIAAKEITMTSKPTPAKEATP